MKKKRKEERPQTSKSVAEALEEIKDRWFRPEMVRLLRLEDETDERIGVNLDLMPSWAGKHLLKVLRVVSDGPGVLDVPRLEFTTSENFGELLGMKSFRAHPCQAQRNL